MYRFFVPPEVLGREPVVLGRELAHRMGRVLRLKPGDHVVLLDNTGWEHEAEVDRITREQVETRLLGKSLARAESATCLHLYQALLKAAKFEGVLQKATELGVSSFTPLVCRRSVAEPPSPAGVARWRRIVQEAAEQSQRGLLPALNPPLTLADAIAGAPGLRLLPWESERARGLRGVLQDAQTASGDRTGSPKRVARSPSREVSLFVGPEGGWGEDEVSLAVAQGAVAVSLGPRILRADTAGLVAAAAILFHAGELGG